MPRYSRTSVKNQGSSKFAQINKAQFCKSCREVFATLNEYGYVLADLYDLNAIQVYPLCAGAKYDIRCYSVVVKNDGDYLQVMVFGNSN